MKKIISLVLSFGFFCTSVAYAADVQLVDSANGVINVSGSAKSGDLISILIMNPEKTIDDAADPITRQYNDVIAADSNGNYSYDIILNMDNAENGGDFRIYVKEGENKTIELPSVYYVTTEKKYEVLKAVVADVTKINNDEYVKKVLGLNATLYKENDMTAVEVALNTNLTANPIVTDDKISDTEKESQFADLMGRIKIIAVISAYNTGKINIVFGEKHSFNYDDIIKFSTLDTDAEVTAYKLYTTSLTAEGKQKVQNGLLNQNFSSIDEVKRMFVKLVMYHGITNHNETGYGHISDYITDKNLQYALNVTDGNTPVETYLSFKDKTGVDYKLKSDTEVTFENFLSKIEKYAKESGSIPQKPNSTGGTGGGNKGSSGNSGPSLTVPVGVTVKQDFSIFTDVPEDHWANEAVEYLAEKSIINGTATGIFAPTDNLTREQAVKIIYSAFGVSIEVDSNDYNIFNDIKAGEWYADFVLKAYKQGFVNGIGDEIFGVGKNITREDVAVMLYRAMGVQGVDVPTGFSDDSEISSYSRAAVSYMKNNGIINGYEDNTFRPKKNITRAEMAKLVYNILTKGD